MSLEFLKPARIDDVVVVETMAGEVTGARGVLSQRIVRGDDVLVTAEVTVAMINDAGKARRWPESVRLLLGGE
jgi:acyl-CoA thioester hydrolase